MTTAIWLIRHGETEWSLAGRHTGRTDLPLLAEGQEAAHRLRDELAATTFTLVLCSPLQRAAATAAIALAVPATVDDDLAEWDYGDLEGRTTPDIRAERPGWDLFRDGAPGGETVDDVGARVDRVVARLHAAVGGGLVAVVAHGHLLRVLAARWAGWPASAGAGLGPLPTAGIGWLGWERERAVVSGWAVGA